jgi:hypothetical protein
MKSKRWIQKFIRSINVQLMGVPHGFYDTFDYTKSEKNLTHPLTMGYIINSLRTIGGYVNIGIDIRLKSRGDKFQPDIVCYRKNEINDSGIELVIDYESPNSSDERIEKKDICNFLKYSKRLDARCRYIIITTLPNRRSPRWQLRYTSFEKYNSKHKGKINRVRNNPFKYWHKHFEKMMKASGWPKNILMMNIDGKHIKVVCFKKQSNK